KDPFTNPVLLGSTSPIPMAFIEELRIDSTGKKLYANYRGAGNIVVLDIDAIRDIEVIDDRKYMPIDNPDFDRGLFEAARNIYSDPIDVSRHGNGLALQAIMALTLVAPTGTEDVHGDNPDPLVFKWRVDSDLLPPAGKEGAEIKTSFFF